MEILMILAALALLFAAVIWLALDAGHDEVENSEDEHKNDETWGKL